jgi:hypothetical protein
MSNLDERVTISTSELSDGTGAKLYIRLANVANHLHAVKPFAYFGHQVWVRCNDRVVRNHFARGTADQAVIGNFFNSIQPRFVIGVGGTM